MNVTATAAVVATRPVDLRKGHDSLAAAVEHDPDLDPHLGVAVVFRSRRADLLCM
ncbi:MAG: IS66 family insertion sequence element accessory protein TnpB [Immundisolibacterales bacterium]|nr:IS66 family insertion sequence element accessory protein TnpB [Immundisolibacterales bacterium]